MKLDDSSTLGEQTVQCPFCTHVPDYTDNVHMAGVTVEPVRGQLLCAIDGDGVRVDRSNAAARQRGASVVIRFYCEAGHLWDTEFRFHKGSTFVEDRLVEETAGPGLEWFDIWRD